MQSAALLDSTSTGATTVSVIGSSAGLLCALAFDADAGLGTAAGRSCFACGRKACLPAWLRAAFVAAPAFAGGIPPRAAC